MILQYTVICMRSYLTLMGNILHDRNAPHSRYLYHLIRFNSCSSTCSLYKRLDVNSCWHNSHLTCKLSWNWSICAFKSIMDTKLVLHMVHSFKSVTISLCWLRRCNFKSRFLSKPASQSSHLNRLISFTLWFLMWFSKFRLLNNWIDRVNAWVLSKVVKYLNCMSYRKENCLLHKLQVNLADTVGSSVFLWHSMCAFNWSGCVNVSWHTLHL